ncbi:MAG: PAS domain S-box protein [Magnetospirillum sp.]|nr:PAS domain S-box protein [Magnetospirillum sp.]
MTYSKPLLTRLSPMGIWGISLALVALLVALTGFQLRAGYDRTIRVAGANLADTARVTEEQVRGSLRVVGLILKSLAEAPRDDPSALRSFMTSQVRVIPEIRQAFITDRSGIVTFSTLPQVEGRDTTKRAFFSGARDLAPGSTLYVDKPLNIGVDNARVIMAASPLRDHRHQFMGIVSVSLELAYFQTLLKSVHSGEDGAGALLVTPEGDIIGRDPDPDTFVGKNIAKGGAFALHRESGQSSSVHVHITQTDGKTKLSAVRTLTDPQLPPLVVIIGRPLDGVLASWRSEALTHSLVVAILALAIFALTGLLQRHIKALGRSEERYRGLIESQSDFIVRIGADDRFVFVNDAFADAFGLPAREIEGQPWQAFIHKDDIAETAKAIAQVTQPPAYRADTENRMPMVSGTRWVAWEGGAIRDHAGRVTEVQAVGRDISQWVEYRERQTVLLRDLDNSNRELEQFAYVASHDLREPLRMISSYMGLLDRRYQNVLDADGRDFLEFAREGARRMDKMVLDLLEFSRVGRIGDPQVPIALDDVLETALANLKLVIEDAGAQISVTDALPVIEGSHGEMVRLFQNLIGNAIKYRSPDRRSAITIAAERLPGQWRISVSDNGIGIAPEYSERIFDIFQRLHTRNEYEGTGIGLAVCRKIVERHGGRIWVESSLGDGATFHFTLPG